MTLKGIHIPGNRISKFQFEIPNNLCERLESAQKGSFINSDEFGHFCFGLCTVIANGVKSQLVGTTLLSLASNDPSSQIIILLTLTGSRFGCEENR